MASESETENKKLEDSEQGEDDAASADPDVKMTEGEEIKEEIAQADEVKEEEAREEEEKQEDGDDEEKEKDKIGVEMDGKSVKRTRKRRSLDSKEEAATTPNARPSRERKVVDRYLISLPQSRSSATKPLEIVKGSGTALKDIPNVAFKLSKRKPDDNLQLLHTILFGKKAKVHNLKKDIGKFSGFVWTENEEKQRAKVKEKLDKCVKEKLVDFCDVLNIQINKATFKKEDLSVKILDFLESPHATTDVLLADKEQKGRKRKRTGTPNKNPNALGSSEETSVKKALDGKKLKQAPEVDEGNESDDKDEQLDPKQDSMGADSDGAPIAESEKDDVNSEEEEKEPKEQIISSKGSSKKENTGAKGAKTSSNKKKSSPVEKSRKSAVKSTKKGNSSSIKDSESSVPQSRAKGSSSKKAKVESDTQKDDDAAKKDEKGKSKQQSSKSSVKSTMKDQGKGIVSRKEAKVQPSRQALFDVAVNLLKEVDFDTATLSDILRQLGAHFGVDLMERRAEVKEIITEVMSDMVEEEDEDEDGNDEDNDGGDDK